MSCSKFLVSPTIVLLGLGLLFALGPVAPVLSQQNDEWTGEGADNKWTNPDNWFYGEVPTGGEIRVNAPAAACPTAR